MKYRWLVTGAGGQFGSEILRTLTERGESVLGLVHHTGSAERVGTTRPVDILDHATVRDVIREAGPEFVVHAAAIANAHFAFQNPELARATNVEATIHLAQVAREVGARVTYISTDLVFDGITGSYDESASPNPLSVYGRSKADAEGLVLQESGVVVRPAILYGMPAVHRPTVFLTQLEAIRSHTRLALFEDQFRSPIAIADAADACITITESDAGGIFHIAGPERLSRLEMGRIMAAALGRSEEHLVATRQADLDGPEPRPADVSLKTERFEQLFAYAPGRPMGVVMEEIVRDFERS